MVWPTFTGCGTWWGWYLAWDLSPVRAHSLWTDLCPEKLVNKYTLSSQGPGLASLLCHTQSNRQLRRRHFFCGRDHVNTSFSLYALFSQLRPRDVLYGLCLLYIGRWMLVHKTKLKEKKNQFSRLPSRSLKWENKTYKLKRLELLGFYCI